MSFPGSPLPVWRIAVPRVSGQLNMFEALVSESGKKKGHSKSHHTSPSEFFPLGPVDTRHTHKAGR